MRQRYFFRTLFLMLATSVALTETRHGVGQVIFTFLAYVVIYFLNQIIIRPDLLSNIHKPTKQKKSLFFRGENYEAMDEVDAEKQFLATSGATSRVTFKRWLRWGLFGMLVVALGSAEKSEKLVSSSTTLFHLFIATTFLSMESLSHSLLPLTLNAFLIISYMTYHEAPILIVVIYLATFFVSLGLYGFSYISKKFSTRPNLEMRIRSTLKMFGLWVIFATILFLVLPGESIKNFLRKPVEKIEKAVEEKIEKHVIPALQKAADQQLPNFEQTNNEAENISIPNAPLPSQEEIKSLQLKLDLALNKESIGQGVNQDSGGNGATNRPGGQNNLQAQNAIEDYNTVTEIFDELNRQPLPQTEANPEQIKKADDALKRLEEFAENINKNQPDADLDGFKDPPQTPTVEEIKELREKFKKFDRGFQKSAISVIRKEKVREEFEKIQSEIKALESSPAGSPKQMSQEQLREFETKLKEIDKFVKSEAAKAPQAQPSTPHLQAESASPPVAVAPQPTEAKAEQTPKPVEPKNFEPPNIDKWWPLIKIAAILLIAWTIFNILNPFFQANSERKAQEKKLTKRDRAKLRAFLKHTQEVRYKDDRDEVIKKYHAFLEVMEFINRPRHESLPAEDYGEELKQNLRRNLQELDALTWGFSDVLYGGIHLDAQRLDNFRKSFNLMARSFLDIP